MKKFPMVFCIMTLIFVTTNMANAAPVQWSVGDGGNGHWYDVIDVRLTWQEAKVLSESMGGYLATLTTQEEDEFVHNNLIQSFSQDCWLGGTDEVVEGVWQWITGETWDYANWDTGEPNDGTGRGQDYLNIYASGVWDDAGPPGWPDDSLFFVIEWDSNPGPIPSPAKFDYVLLGSEVRQYDPSRYSFDKSSIWYKGNPYWFMITFAGTSGDPPVYPVFLDAPIYSDPSNTEPYGLNDNPNYVTHTNFSASALFPFWGFDPPGPAWEDKTYTFFIDANGNSQLDSGETKEDWLIPLNSIRKMSVPQNISVSGGIHPTTSWDSVPNSDVYMVNFYSILESGFPDFDVRLHTSGYITATSYTYTGDLFRDGKEYAIWVQAREFHPEYSGLFINRSGYFTKHRAINKLNLLKPGWIIISDTVGILWALNVETKETYKYHEFDESFWYGNFDIQYIGSTKLLVANYENSRIEEFDLRTKELSKITDPLLRKPIGVCVSARGYYYIADHAGYVFSYDLKTETLEILADSGPNGEAFIQPDGIVEDKKGRVIMTDHGGRIYRITPRNKFIEILAEIPGHYLNGVVLTKKGQLIVASELPAAIFKVDPDTGEYLTLYEGDPLRNPEDIAIDSDGNIHILDSDFMRLYEDFLPGIYVLEKGSSQLNTLYTGEPFQDVVDLLLTPFRGF